MYGSRWDRSRSPLRPAVDALATAHIAAIRDCQDAREAARLAAHNARLYLDGLES
jgi:hypothetical protein